MLTTTMKALMSHVAPVGYGTEPLTEKVTVVGAGSVGTTIAFALLSMVSIKSYYGYYDIFLFYLLNTYAYR